jgi:hypothetical protein
MNSSLLINGYALYLFFGTFFAIVLGLIFFGCAYLKERAEREKFERKYNNVCDKLIVLKEKYRKATFKVPEIDVVKNDNRK